MSWKDMLFQGLVGLMEILATIAKAIGMLLVLAIKVWEPICCAGLFFILGSIIGKALGLPKGPITAIINYDSFTAILTILGLVFGAALATRRLNRKV
jgi:hypothetical protein